MKACPVGTCLPLLVSAGFAEAKRESVFAWIPVILSAVTIGEKIVFILDIDFVNM